MTKKTCALHNLGCKVNEYETDAMKQQMMEAGYEIVSFEDRADVYIINTCSVTNIADRKSRQMLHRARKRNPQAVIVAAGCYVQVGAEQLIEEGCADIILGNNQKRELPDLVAQWEENREQIARVFDIGTECEYEELQLGERVEHTRAFLKIQDGCNQFCSYCIIPFARGRVRSRQPAAVLAEAGRLAAQGYQEIVLTGIHLSSYGIDFEEDSEGEEKTSKSRAYDPKKTGPLLSLLQELEKIEGLSRIRLGSLEPRIIQEPFVRELVKLKKLCPHFHLSLQSGCDATLQRMNRRYTTEEFAQSAALLRQYYEHPAITTDVIIGFAGETQEEFEQTRAFLTRVCLYELHVFPFSIRKGTRAEKLPGQNTEAVKKSRCRELLALTQQQSREFRAWYLGQEVEVLTEERVEEEGQIYTIGFTKEYVKVAFLGDEWELNSKIRGNVTGFLGNDKMLAE